MGVTTVCVNLGCQKRKPKYSSLDGAQDDTVGSPDVIRTCLHILCYEKSKNGRVLVYQPKIFLY